MNSDASSFAGPHLETDGQKIVSFACRNGLPTFDDDLGAVVRKQITITVESNVKAWLVIRDKQKNLHKEFVENYDNDLTHRPDLDAHEQHKIIRAYKAMILRKNALAQRMLTELDKSNASLASILMLVGDHTPDIFDYSMACLDEGLAMLDEIIEQSSQITLDDLPSPVTDGKYRSIKEMLLDDEDMRYDRIQDARTSFAECSPDVAALLDTNWESEDPMFKTLSEKSPDAKLMYDLLMATDPNEACDLLEKVEARIAELRHQ